MGNATIFFVVVCTALFTKSLVTSITTNGMMWHKALIVTTDLESPDDTALTGNVLECATYADKNNPGAPLLISFENSTCNIFLMDIRPYVDQGYGGTINTTHCFTNSQLPPPVCDVNGVVYNDGSLLPHHCRMMICQNEGLSRFEDVCPVDYNCMGALGCVSLEGGSGTEAAQVCQNIQGKLAIYHDVTVLTAIGAGSNMYVGIAADRKWADGTDIPTESWDPTDTLTDGCGYYNPTDQLFAYYGDCAMTTIIMCTPL